MKLNKSMLLVSICAICSCVSNSNNYYSSENYLPYNYREPVTYYQAKADSAINDFERDQALLKVAGRLIQDGMLKRAEQQLKKLDSLPASLNNEKFLLEAKLALLNRQPQKSLKQASKVSHQSQMDPGMQAFYHQILASAYRLSGKTINEISQLIELENLQNSKLSKLATRRLIWRSLSSLSLTKEKALALDSQGELEGWLSLNLITKELRDDGNKLIKAVLNWQQQHPTHSANDIVKVNQQNLLASPKNIALLLPLSGKLKGPGQAIRDGFMASYFEGKTTGASVKFYDTNNSDVQKLYQQAVKKGADLVIGPLTKDNVELLSRSKLSVPTIALNDVDDVVTRNLYQFSVDPQNEAKQLATKVYQDGFRNALVIAPSGKWGESIANTFLTKWYQQGGKLTDKLYFDDKTNINSSIKKLLDISDSNQRKNDLVRTIWKRPKFYPRRRQDFDVVVLLSHASKARQIRPMLKYHYAGDVPVYGTSLLYSGSPKPQSDVDLNGIIFGEMPYLLNNRKSLVTKAWPEQFNSYNRLYALGKDASLLSHQLNQLKLFPLMGALNNTGTLFLDEQGQIIRQLQWAKFKNGLAKSIPN